MMRNLIFTILFFLSLSSHAQEYSAIKGFVKNDRLKEVTFYKTVDGNIQACATSQVAPDGSYGFLLRPEPGFYSIGEKWVNFPLYLQGGEEVNIDLYRTQAKLNGKNTPENETLYRWVDYAANIRTKAVFFDQTLSNYEDFFPDFGIYLKGLPDVRKKLKSGNAAFDRLLAEYVDYSTDFYALLFLATPRDKHPESPCGRNTTNTLPRRRNIRRMSYCNFRKGSECWACTPSLPTGSQGKKRDIIRTM